MLTKIKNLLREYLLNSSLHGLTYLVEPGRHWVERLFWLSLCSVSWWIATLVILSSWSAYQNSAVSFVVDTNYLDWETEFPAIYVCETDNEEKVSLVSDRIFGAEHDYNLDEMVKELSFYTSHNFFTLRACGPNTTELKELCPKGNLSDISPQVRSSCTELFRNCLWRGEFFDCCSSFMTIQTDLGSCFALNSMQLKDRNKLSMISNAVLGPGSLRLELNGQSQVYVLGRMEIPAFVSSKQDYFSVEPGTAIERRFTVKEIANLPEVRDLSINQRKCRYPDENYLDVFPYYSYSVCLMQCRKRAQLEKCGCAHHLMPRKALEEQCNITGLACIQSNFNELFVQKPPASKKVGIVCDCLVSCIDMQLDIVTENLVTNSQEFSTLDISLERLPTERFKRIVVKGPLDIAVSIGSAIALFIGASFLTLSELVFYFLIRPLDDYLKARYKKKSLNSTFRY